MTNEAPRAWQRMLSGRRLDLLKPSPDDIEIEDIAHGLARVARWNGQTVGAHALSVAQHSVIVSDIVTAVHADASANVHRAALLHDAAEYVIGDLISPFKAAIGFNYKAFETRLLDAIFLRFGITPLDGDAAAIIKAADRTAAYFEASVLAGFEKDEAMAFFGSPVLPVILSEQLSQMRALPANDAQALYLQRFHAMFAV